MTDKVILVADDDKGIRTVISHALSRCGYEVKATENAATLWEWVSNGLGDLVVMDVIMPDENGLDLLPRILKLRPKLRVIMMSAQNTIMTALRATKGGAFEYLAKPFDINDLSDIVRRGLEPLSNPESTQIFSTDENLPLIGRSQAMQETYRTLARLMNNNLTVMIHGESGTGKELVAKALHNFGKQKTGPFIAINMAAIPRELIESELFGHEKGAFTGAMTNSTGRFAQANGGTLFLDEIGDMPIEIQTRLLRVLQEGEFTSVGGVKTTKVNVRIIAATHQDLSKLIRKGLFREDLYFRLNVVPIRLPPLRNRTEDIPELFQYFVNQGLKTGLPSKILDNDAMSILQAYSWPGNVRELENLTQRLAVLYSDEIITSSVIKNMFKENLEPKIDSNPNSLKTAIDNHLTNLFKLGKDNYPKDGLYNRELIEFERPLITMTLKETRGNQVKAAKILGLNRNTLRKKISQLKIPIIRGG